MRKRTFIENARVTALTLALFLALALAACNSGAPAPTDVSPTAPETTPPTASPSPVPPPLPGSETVKIDLSGEDLTNERLAQMVANGEIPANVTNLLLWGNQISDISPLAGLSNLTELNIADNQISDLSPIGGLTNLTELAMASNPISDLTPIGGLTKLLNLHMLGIQASDITPLRGLTNLTVMYLSSDQISDIGPLRGLTNLTYLYLRTDRLNDLTPLHALQNLTHLQLDITMSQSELDSLKAALPNCLILYEYSVVTPIVSDLLIIDELEPFEGNALLYLGMRRGDAWNILIANIGIDDVQGGNAFYSSIDDGYHNAHEFEGFSYNTDKNDALYIVTVSLERYQPTSGLRLGATFAQVIELYGSVYTEYTEDESGFSKYEYIIGDHFFSVSFVDGTAYAWRVSNHSEQAFRDAFIDNTSPTDDFT